MEVTFATEKQITVVEASIINILACQVEQVIDNSINKTITAILILSPGIYKTVLLWKDDEYDLIGQWKDSDVIDKVKELL